MRAAHPGVHCILVPEEPAEIMPTMRRITLLDRFEVTKEDRGRADMMRAEQERETLSVHLSKEDFLRDLGLKVELFPASTEEMDRIAQLVNKTNQFNLTTIRRSLDELRALAAGSAHRIFGLRVVDKFGDYGLTGVAIAECHPGEQWWVIDTFLLSCRVLGRKVETAFLAGLAAEARSDGARELLAAFIPTAKNAPAATFLMDHGFENTGGESWRIAISDVPMAPVFTKLVILTEATPVT